MRGNPSIPQKILLNTVTIREVNSTEIEFFFCLKLCGERNLGLRATKAASYKQPNKFSQLQNTKSVLLTVTFVAIEK